MPPCLRRPPLSKPVLCWPGRAPAVRPSPCALREEPALGHGPARDSLVIQGDNLPVLAALAPEWAGGFTCAYLDPPYNTGGRFGAYDDARASTDWLDDLAARVQAVRPLLAPEGVLLLALDDSEAAYARVLCDEILGREAHCGTLVWEKKRKPSFLDGRLASVTEWILVYARDPELARPLVGGRTTRDKMVPLNNAGNGISVLRFPAGAVRFGMREASFDAGDMSAGRVLTRLLDPVVVREHRNVEAFRLEGEWRYAQSTLDALLAEGGRIVIRRAPFRPNHLRPGGGPKKLKNLLTRAHYDAPTYEDGTAESRALFGVEHAFPYPKPEGLLRLLLEATTRPGEAVLDPYAGSGTTGAVALKLGRRFVLVEQAAQARTHIVPRLRKVVDGEDPGGVTASTGWRGGGGFRFLGAPGA